MNKARWFYAQTGRKGIAQGKAKRRPGIRDAIIFASPERAEPAARQSMRTCSALSGLWRIGAAGYSARWRTTQGGAALYPGLSHCAPLGRTIRLRIGVDRTLQATQVVVGYSGWRLPDGPMPQRGGGIAGSLNDAQWFYAPTGRKVIAQGKAKRRPGILCARNSPSPERAEPAVRQSMRTCFALSGLWRIGASAYPGRSRTTQGGASHPGWRCALPWAISLSPVGAAGDDGPSSEVR